MTAADESPTPPAVPWGPHFKGLRGVADVNTVATDHVQDIRARFAEAVRDRTIVLVTGKVGSGKSFAVARGLESALQRTPTLSPVWLELSTSTRGRTLARDLFPQTTGVHPRQSASLGELRDDMAFALSERHRVLVLDEAQNVGREAMQLLRWLWDRPDSDFALVVVGTPDLERKIPTELSSRIVTEIQVGRIADDAAPALLAAYHPVFADAPPALLSRLNRTKAFGEFRWWAKFLSRTVLYLPKLGSVLDDEAAEVIAEELRDGEPE